MDKITDKALENANEIKVSSEPIVKEGIAPEPDGIPHKQSITED